MTFRFFRPWEDDWTPNTPQTPASHHETSAEHSATTLSSHVVAGPSLQTNESHYPPGKTRTPQKLSDADGALSGIKKKTTAVTTDVNRKNLKSSLESVESLSFQELMVPLATVLSPTHADAVSNQDAQQNGSIGSVTSSKESLFSFGISTAGGTSSSPSDIYKANHDNDSKSFKCNICEKAFSNSSSLHCHERTHTGSKAYRCKSCEKAFLDSRKLHTHERTHTGSKPFNCRFCKKVFTQNSCLRVHERTHTRSKPFKCQLCEKAFTQSSNLRDHERTHTGSKPFMCQFCEKFFRQSNHHRVHERTHTGFKPFKCQYCEKAFSKSSNLRVHERTHTGIRPFKCRFCDKTFSASNNLHRHERIHASSKPS